MKKSGDANCPAVGNCRDRAVAVGAVNGDARRTQPVEHFGRRMSERVVLADGNGADFRVNRGEKIFRGRGFAAVVGNFEEIGGEIGSLRENGSLGGPFDVAGEKQMNGGVGNAQDNGVVIFCFCDPIIRCRPQDAAVNSVPIGIVPHSNAHDANSACAGDRKKLPVRGDVNVVANPQFTDAKICQDSRKSAEMILVRVREDDDVKPLQVPGP